MTARIKQNTRIPSRGYARHTGGNPVRVTNYIVSTILSIGGIVAAVFAFLPYGWGHLVSGAILVAIAAYHGAPLATRIVANRVAKGSVKP